MQNEDLIRELNKLTEMHAAGVLSNEQFAQAKARLLAPPGASAGPPPFPPAGTYGPPPAGPATAYSLAPPAGPIPGYGPPPSGPGRAGAPLPHEWLRMGIAACGALTLLAFFAIPLVTVPILGGITGVQAAAAGPQMGAGAFALLWLVPLASAGVCGIGVWSRFGASIVPPARRTATIAVAVLAGLVVLIYLIMLGYLQNALSDSGAGHFGVSATSFTGVGFWFALLAMLGAAGAAVVELVSVRGRT